jgi:hypothetical protein
MLAGRPFWSASVAEGAEDIAAELKVSLSAVHYSCEYSGKCKILCPAPGEAHMPRWQDREPQKIHKRKQGNSQPRDPQ